MPNGATARLFVALDPPLYVREELAGWARVATAGWRSRGAAASGPSLRVLEARSLHLTLCFLGARPVAKMEALAATLGSCVASVGELAVGAPVWLPPRRARALAVEIHDHAGELAALQRAASEALTRASGWEPERRRWRAHITLARVRDGGSHARRSVRAPREQPLLSPTPQLRFTPVSIVLYRSWLEPSGASYEAIAAVELMAPGPAGAAAQSCSSPPSATLHTSAEPSLEMTGVEPSSQAGSEPSSQE